MKQKSPNQGEGVNVRYFNEEYWCEGTHHEPKNLKLQINKKTSNNKHEQPKLKLDKSQMTKTQRGGGHIGKYMKQQQQKKAKNQFC